MKTLRFILPVLLTFTLHAADRVALVIGNDAYQHARPLETAVNDASAVAGALQKLGFETLTASNAGLESMIEALDTLRVKAAGARAVLVYYAGHGIESNGTNYLVPVDAKLERELQLRTQALSMDSLLEELKRMNVPARMVILDCCRDNPLEGRSWLATRGSSGGLATLDQDTLNEATLVVYSASPGKPALDRMQDRDAHSPFTQALLDELPQPGIHSFEVFGRVEESVIKTTAGKQKPRLFYNGSTLPFREFRFAQGATAPQAPAPSPAVVQSAPPAPAPAEAVAAEAGPALPARGYFDLQALYEGGPYSGYNSYSRTRILTQVQEVLKKQGLYTSSADGTPGPGTQRALIAWQRAHAVPVSGRLDTTTLKALNLDAVREQQAPAPKPVAARPATPRPQPAASRQPTNPAVYLIGPPASSESLDEQFRRAATKFEQKR
ncbi:caspase family protein [Prosthecobacter sp.]|uniref:caspase family protein n=1 Tax=Prosthecobacter sp. TaxID=1965333 RepID=UPI003782D917